MTSLFNDDKDYNVTIDGEINKFYEIEDRLDQIRANTYENMFRMFQVDIEAFFEEEFVFLKQLHFSPLDFDEMEYYRYYYLRKNYLDYLEKEKEAREKEEKGSQNKFDHKRMMDDTRKMMPNMNMSGWNAPAGVPSLPSMPKF